jgi:hypothetical protein
LVRRVASGQETTADLKARLRGFRGESRVAKALRTLPEGWHIFHEVGLMDGNIDYVVAGPRGVFTIEVIAEAGSVVANARGLYTNGRRNNRPVERAMRHAAQLEARLGVEVKPALSIVGTDLTGHEVDGLPVFLLDELAGFLLNDDGRRLTWEEAKRVLDTLGAMTR